MSKLRHLEILQLAPRNEQNLVHYVSNSHPAQITKLPGSILELIPKITFLILPKFSPKPQRIDGQRQHLRQCRLQHGRQEALQLRAIAWSVTRLDIHFIGSKHANHMAIFLELYIIP